MAQQPLNLYASRILQESPLVVWPIDEKADFYNFIQENKRSVTSDQGWTITGGSSELLSQKLGTEPFPESASTRIVANSTNGVIDIESPVLTSFAALSSYLSTYTVSSFFMFASSSVTKVSIGIRYTDPTSGIKDIVKTVPIFSYNAWVNISETFDIPHDYIYDIKVIFKIYYTVDLGLTMYTNGLSLAQWSEEFNVTSLGTDLTEISPDIYGVDDYTKAIRIYGAGEPNNDGFILVDKQNQIAARSVGIPLVFGAESSSYVEHRDDQTKPSIILPANDFLMESGKYKTQSLEFWAKLSNSSAEKVKIVGPIGSSDGLYVEGPFLRLQIGNNYGSYAISEWGRPMLIHMVLQQDKFELLINGNKVISISINKDSLSLSPSTINGKNAAWIGFYGSEHVEPFELDCVSICTYAVTTEVAKKRFLYGQGVQVPTSLDTAYNGKTVSFDYEFSKYSQNFDYPTKALWTKGKKNNVVVDGTSMYLPKYNKPSIISKNISETLLMTKLASVQNDLSGLFFSFKPDSSVNESESYLSFDSINQTQDPTVAIYTSAKISSSNDGQTIMRIQDTLSPNNISFYVSGHKIKATAFINSKTIDIYETEIIDGELMSFGLNFDRVSSYYGGEIRSFLSNRSNLSLYIGGYKGAATFTGKIFNVSFLNNYDFGNVSDAFDEIGFIWSLGDSGSDTFVSGTYWDNAGTQILATKISDAGTKLYSDNFINYLYDGGYPNGYANTLLSNYLPAYQLVVKKDEGICSLDIAASGIWSDNIPLSYFEKPYLDGSGATVSGIDYIQLNVSYPSPGIYEKVEKTTSIEDWKYSTLAEKFSNPVQKVYSDLDNHLYTGYVDYESLRTNTEFLYRYNTDRSLVKTYVYFKPVDNSISYDDPFYSNIVYAPKNRVITPGEEWISTKYEFVDNTVVYMPPNIDPSKVALCFDIKFEVVGIEHNPIFVNKLSFASQTFNKTAAKPIGTKFGKDVYPFSKSGFYYDYKVKNPITITKQSTPHLYLNKSNGVSLVGDFDNINDRGIYIPINKEKSSNYKVAAMNMFMMYEYDFFPYAPKEIFAIRSNTSSIKFYIQSVHPEGRRAKIFAINQKTGQIENGISFFLNGKLVNSPVITIKQWFSLGVVFATYVDTSGHEGSIEIIGPMSFDNISFFAANRLQQVQVTTDRTWSRVESPVLSNVDWMFWMPYIWQEVLVMSSRTFYGIDPGDIYKLYTGTNRLIVDDGEKVRTRYYQYRVINGAGLSNSTITPV